MLYIDGFLTYVLCISGYVTLLQTHLENLEHVFREDIHKVILTDEQNRGKFCSSNLKVLIFFSFVHMKMDSYRTNTSSMHATTKILARQLVRLNNEDHL